MRGSFAPLISCCGYPPRNCECPSAAAPSPGGSGGAGAFLPRANASAPIPAPVNQSSDDLLSQQTNVDRIFHEGVNR